MKNYGKKNVIRLLVGFLYLFGLTGANACEQCLRDAALIEEIRASQGSGQFLPEKELKVLTDKATSGDMMSLRCLAARYSIGAGVEKNEDKGRELFEKMAEMGDPSAMRILASIYSRGGGGLPVDVQKGVDWYMKAAESGDFRAARTLCRMYVKGTGGVSIDQKKANDCALLAEKAAMGKECTKDFLTLATLYESGVGFPKNAEKSVVFYKAAAEKGIIGAMLKLSMIFYEGALVDADPVEGKMWMSKAIMALQAEGVSLGAPHQHTADCRH